MRIYRASELGGCTKMQIAKQLGYQQLSPPKKMQDVYDAGNLYEEVAKDRLRSDGWEIRREQAEVNLEITSNVIVQGHIDGHATDRNVGAGVLEIKSMSNDNFQLWLRDGWRSPGLVQKYKWQVSPYMLATGLPLWFVVINRDDSNEPLAISQIPFPQVFHAIEDIRARVLAMDTLVRLGELPGECESDMGWACPVRYLHTADYELSDNDDIAAVAIAYKTAQTNEKVAKEEKVRLRKELDRATLEASFHHAKVDVTYYKQNNPPKYDEKKLKEHFGEDLADYKTQTSGTRVRVTIHEEGDGGS